MLFLIDYQKQRRAEAPDPDRGDLVVSTGSFIVTDTGVLCRLKPPLSRLSGHYDWTRVPFGIASLKLLVVGETDAFDLMIKVFDDKELDMLESGLGKDESAYLAHDIEQVLSWAPNLASHCPLSWVSHDLARIPEMTTKDLGNYVGRYLGLG